MTGQIAVFMQQPMALPLTAEGLAGSSKKRNHWVTAYEGRIPILCSFATSKTWYPLVCNLMMKVFAERLKGYGFAPKAVIAACMQKLLRQIYGLLKSRKAFDAHFLGNRLDLRDGI